MSQTVQHIIVFAVLAGCVGFVILQFARTFAGRKSAAGSCCSKGCASQAPAESKSNVQFVSIDSLKRAAKKS